ncbi:AAA family ATPase, partial [Candidatus Saccharibacteria bacterium]|nr:AAA family ATPase [Candidatus Saccharibacteria bacterium]
TETTTETTIAELINATWKNDVRMDKKTAMGIINGNNASNIIRQERIAIISNSDGTVTFTRNNVVPTVSMSHKYVMPHFADEVRALIKRAINGKGMANICLTGMAGTGKTEFIYELANEFGIKVFQVNGSDGLTSADFYGTMSVAVDTATKQNYTFFEKGPLYRAFIEGTMQDEHGNQILDENGESIVVGKPSFFFLDEFAAMLPELFLGVFNRALEIPRTYGKSRSIEVSMDNGRVVKSHPGMVVFLAGNTVGAGNGGRYQMGYTAQGNQMDESTRNRITAFYRFGYNKNAELSVALGKLNDDYEVNRLLKFRDNVRKMFKEEKINSLFTTRSLVAVCEMATALREINKENWVAEAIKSVLYNGLPCDDQSAYNELVRILYGIDFEKKMLAENEYDYL